MFFQSAQGRDGIRLEGGPRLPATPKIHFFSNYIRKFNKKERNKIKLSTIIIHLIIFCLDGQPQLFEG